MVRASGLIGRLHVGTCQRNLPAKLSSIKYSTSPRVRKEAHWARSRLGFNTSLGLIGLSAGGRLKARRQTANGLTPPVMERTNERNVKS